MKRILGLDIGVSSVGLAIITEENKKTKIEHLSVRVIPEDPDFHGKFYSGNTASKNLERTIKRGIRRNNQRFKARRNKLHSVLKSSNMFPEERLFSLTVLDLYEIRAKSVSEKISLQELGRVLILLNQRRGFLSNRKSISADESSSEYKERIAQLENKLGGNTIGQQLFFELKSSNRTNDILLRERTYQRISYINEFDIIWDKQKEFYPDVLTGGSQIDDNRGTLYDLIKNRVIYYQRPLKSQKGLVSNCEFESWPQKYIDKFTKKEKIRTVGHKAVTKSSPYFEIFRIWQKVNDLSWKDVNGNTYMATSEQRKKLYNALFFGNALNGKFKLTISEIKKILGYSAKEKIYINFPELDGSRTYSIIKEALINAGINNYEKFLKFNYIENDEKKGLFELWHITYSLPYEDDVINTLVKRFNFTIEQSKIIADNIGYPTEYGNLSTRAIKKLLPFMEKGLGYSEACDKVGYDHSGYKTKIEIQDRLKPIVKNSLRNPVVEQVLNQVVNMVNLAIEKYGKFDEIRVELARELKNSAKTRKNITKKYALNRKINDKVRKVLKEDYGYRIVNGRDVKRIKLWEETNKTCLYCNKPIQMSDIINGQADIEHILPKSRSYSNAMPNYILAHSKCNSDKKQMTAYDFMSSKGDQALEEYIEHVNKLYKNGKGQLSESKFNKLLTKGEDIPSDFVERMLKDSQYIAKEAVNMLRTVCENVNTTTGQITDLLRKEWKLKDALQEVMISKYRELGQIEIKEYKDSAGDIKQYETIKSWTKRDDHRHHAVDALICALTDQKIIFRLNNLNKIFQYARGTLSQEELAKMEEMNGTRYDLKEFIEQGAYEFKPPIPNLRKEVISHLENIFISFKKDNSKVLTKNINRVKNGDKQTTWVPRGRLHEDTIMGKVKLLAKQKVKLQKILNNDDFELIENPNIRAILRIHLEKYNNDFKLAFSSKVINNERIKYKSKELKEVAVYKYVNTKRVALSENFTLAQLGKIIDKEVKVTLEEYIKNNGGKIKEAFKGFDENPIRFNNGTNIKSVTVKDESKVEAIRKGYALTGNNHHALIFKNEKGDYKDKVVPFYDAVAIGLLNIEETGKPFPIINRKHDSILGEFQFSLQKNDLFVVDLKHSESPQEENELNFFDDKNRKVISSKLFRVQKMSKKNNGVFDILFRHHLETTINRNIKEITVINFQSNKYFKRLTKVRLNHLGQIVKIGE